MRPDGPRPDIVGPDDGPEAPFPLRLDGKVIKGFGRGSAELGIPTANIPIEGLTVGGHENLESGVYYGWAGLSPHTGATSSTSNDNDNAIAPLLTSSGAVYPMVMSIGWNPYYGNSKRSVEVHIMQQFDQDFYDAHMNLAILGFIRPEYDYVSVDALIEDIRTDIAVTARCLARPGYRRFRQDKGLVDFEGKGDVGR